MKITGAVSGSYGITKTGAGTLWLTNTSDSFSGPINVQNGTLMVSTWAALPTADAITLGGTGTIGTIFLTGNLINGSDESNITRSIVLTGEGGELTCCGWTDAGWTGQSAAASSFNGVISAPATCSSAGATPPPSTAPPTTRTRATRMSWAGPTS